MNRFLFAGVLGGSLLGAFAACTGDAGPTGAAGPPGSAGANGQQGVPGAPGPAGQGVDGGATLPDGEAAIVISERARHGLDISPVPVALAGVTSSDAENIGTGSYLVNAVAGCGSCHGAQAATFLAGGATFGLGGSNSVTARNLTPDATGMKLTESQFIEAMRTGKDFKDASGQSSLLVMPWQYYRWLSHSDLRAIFAYLRAIPAVANPTAADTKPSVQPVAFTSSYTDGDVARALPPEVDAKNAPVPDPNYVLRGMAIAPLATPAPADVTQAALYGRGSYLVNAASLCGDCHTNAPRVGGKVNTAAYLTGGRVFPTAAALQPVLKTVRSMSTNLTGAARGAIVKGMTFPGFLASLTQGGHFDDPTKPLAPPMPWQTLRNLELGDLEAIYTYLRVTSGTIAGANDKATQDAARYCTRATEALDCTATGNEKCSGVTGECIGRTCTTDTDCDACQTCNGTCAAAGASSACVSGGL